MKKLLSVTLSLVILLGCIAFTPITSEAAASPYDEEAITTIYNAIVALEDSVDVREYDLEFDFDARVCTELNGILTHMMNNYPELFYFNFSISFNVESRGTDYYVADINLAYNQSVETIPAAVELVDDTLDGIIAGFPGITEWSEVSKALVINDYLAAMYNYDYTYENDNVYEMITTGEGVCQAFTGMYTLLLRKLGMAVSYAASPKGQMNHIWNVVKIGDEWYHVDTTWNDSVTTGHVYHKYFLRSDGKLATPEEGVNKHFSWTSPIGKCTDTEYDEYFWNDVMSPFVVNEDESAAYYIRNFGPTQSDLATIVKYDFGTGEAEDLQQIDGFWLTPDGEHYYTDCFSGLTGVGRYLVYNDFHNVYALIPGSDPITVATFDKPVFGTTVISEDGKFYVMAEVTNQPLVDAPDEKREISLPCAYGHVAVGEWKSDGINHWHECQCGGTVDTANHSWNDGVITVQPTHTAAGTKTFTCTACVKTKTEAVAATGHSFGTEWASNADKHWHECSCGEKSDEANHSFTWVVDTAATATTTGVKHEECACGFKRNENTVIPVEATKLKDLIIEGKGSFADGKIITSQKLNLADILSGNVKAFRGSTEVTGYIATGDTVNLYDEGENIIDTATAIVKGDIFADGKVTIIDAIQLRLHILGTALNDAQYLAADASGDTRVNILDFIQIRLYLLGLAEIK